MIRHSVILKFKDEISVGDKQAFFAASRELAKIPNVQKFEMLMQTNPKNKFEYGISMEFDNQEQYDIYNNHPDHQDFIQNFWIKNVADFLEIDYELM
jgi:hypothetical protein